MKTMYAGARKTSNHITELKPNKMGNPRFVWFFYRKAKEVLHKLV